MYSAGIAQKAKVSVDQTIIFYIGDYYDYSKSILFRRMNASKKNEMMLCVPLNFQYLNSDLSFGMSFILKINDEYEFPKIDVESFRVARGGADWARRAIELVMNVGEQLRNPIFTSNIGEVKASRLIPWIRGLLILLPEFDDITYLY